MTPRFSDSFLQIWILVTLRAAMPVQHFHCKICHQQLITYLLVPTVLIPILSYYTVVHTVLHVKFPQQS